MIIRRTLQHIELFAGIGGFRTAMDILGRDKIARFKHVGYSEIDRKAVQTYCANYDTENEVVMGDIVHFTESVERIGKLPNFDLLTGGFPCQTFSMMGHQRGFDDERGLMFFRIMDIVRVKHPPYILLENVKNLYTHDKRRTFTRIVEELKAAGYNVVYDIFNTQNFCLPQTRNRVLIFATLEPLPNNFIFSSKAVKECFEFNKSRMSVRQSDTVIGILEKNVPDKYMLSERIKPTLLADGSAGFKSKSEINQLIARPLTASMHKMHRACQDNYYSLDFIASDGAVNQAINLSKDEQARLPIRKLTPKEAMLLQGFPEDFAAKASAMGVADGALYKQAGNAVSVNTIYAVLFYLITNKIIQ